VKSPTQSNELRVLVDTIEALRDENCRLIEEVKVARRSSQITADMVVEQFSKLGAYHERLEDQVRVEKDLRNSLSDKLKEGELRERELDLARSAAEAANRTKSTFLANMSHELRTPLNAIIGYSELLEEEAADMEEGTLVIPDLKKIRSAGKHLLALINDILDLSKIEAGKFELLPEFFDVELAVKDVLTTVLPLLEKNNNRVELTCAPDTGQLKADLVRVRQCLFNLISNASKFTEDGVISIELSRRRGETRDWIVCRISDTGIGMSEETLAKLFQPFTQADDTATRKYKGTGLGLTITKRFIELMGGDIVVESTYGMGATFQFELPANSEAKMSAAAAIESAPSTAEWTLLAIDDDPDVLEWLRRTLPPEEFHVITATNGVQGLQLARQHIPDAIVLDIIMPEMDGWEVLSALKSDPVLCEVPVVVATLYENRGMGFALGAADYLTKPIDRSLLVKVLERVCMGDGAARRVLIVEDDEAARETMRRTLQENWHVSVAENGRLALEALDETDPEVILLDLMMPEMDGFEFLERIRALPRWSHVPVIVVTAKELTGAERTILQSQTEKIVEKGSYRRRDLLSEIRRVTSNRRRALAAQAALEV